MARGLNAPRPNRARSADVPGLAARKAALAALSDVLRRRRPLDSALDAALGDAPWPARDAGFVRALATETLRRFGQLEALIRVFVPKLPPPHKAGIAVDILLLGAAELLFLESAPHAAVDAANRLAQTDSKAVHFKGLINAVLRRIAREGADVVAAQDLRLNTPDWLWARWCARYGDETAESIARVHAGVPPLDLHLKNADDLCTDLPGAEAIAPGMVRLVRAGRIEALPGFAEGRWWVQDVAAALPARLLGDVAGAHVVDLCAAPGGKTAQLAARGARVTALDVSAERLGRVSDNLARLNLRADLVAADARDWRPESRAPFVLLDAPCTATGTVRRHPDLVWIKSAADIAICESLQGELIEAAAAMTAPGGTLVYAVCSLEAEEGVERIDRFLAAHPDFARRPVTADASFDSAFISAEGDLRTLPCHWAEKGGMDGFYAARLVRR